MRHEIKYRIEGVQESKILESILMHPAGFREHFPDRIINNIYFDTPNQVSFYQNVDGHDLRKKYRLRWYGASLLPQADARLELKYKQNELGGKQIKQLQCKGLDFHTICQNAVALSDSGAPLEPVLFNRYERSYFLSFDERFRITIDRKIAYKLPSFPSVQAFVVPHMNVRIMELKYEQSDHEDVESITDYIAFPKTKNSKYVEGMLTNYGVDI